MRRILVTGASGFVGRHALHAFRRGFPGAEILGVGRRAAVGVPDGVGYRGVDLHDGAALARLVAAFRPTDVLHLAAQSSVAKADRLRFEAWRANVGIVYHLTDALDRVGTPCTLVFASSGEVYGRAFATGLPATEETQPQPVSAYARSKAMGERFLIDALDGTGIKPIIMRPFNHIGPGQDRGFAIASFADQIARIEAGTQPPLLRVGNLASQRDFLAVADVVAAYAAVLRDAADIPAAAVFNVCSGVPRSLDSALLALRAMSTARFDVQTDPDRARPAEIARAFGDAERLRRATGWRPEIGWEDALRSVLADARHARR